MSTNTMCSEDSNVSSNAMLNQGGVKSVKGLDLSRLTSNKAGLYKAKIVSFLGNYRVMLDVQGQSVIGIIRGRLRRRTKVNSSGKLDFNNKLVVGSRVHISVRDFGDTGVVDIVGKLN